MGKTLRIGMLGLGAVGTSVVEILHRNADIIAQRAGVHLEVVRALVRQVRRKRLGVAQNIAQTSSAANIIVADDIDIVVEVMGGVEPARGLIVQALQAGKPVVTANKAVLAQYGTEILQAAKESGSGIYFEGAVAGGIPIVRTLREGLASDRIWRVRGILNGTTNFILSLMEKGEPYDVALKQAQALRYAEADPTLDITGIDAADKLAILVRLAFGMAVHPNDIPTEGITALSPEVLEDARKFGYRVKLLAVAERVHDQLALRVHPAFVRLDHHLSTVNDIQNAISVDSDALGTTLYMGPGAGGLPTGSAVVADLMEASRNLLSGVAGIPITKRVDAPKKLLMANKMVSAFYIRFLVADEPGVLATLAKILAQSAISLASVIQHDRGRGDEPVPVVIITHPTTYGAIHKALNKIKELPILHGGLSVVAIEEPRQ